VDENAIYVPSQYEISYPIAPETELQLKSISEEETVVAFNPVGFAGVVQVWECEDFGIKITINTRNKTKDF